jgi:hypothetical protein
VSSPGLRLQPELGSWVCRRAPVARQWLGGRRGPNSAERSGGANQCVGARASMRPGVELRVVGRLGKGAQERARRRRRQRSR